MRWNLTNRPKTGKGFVTQSRELAKRQQAVSAPSNSCQNCGSRNLSTRDDSDPDNGYRDPERPWCENCRKWAD